jgi:hypothetical protein
VAVVPGTAAGLDLARPTWLYEHVLYGGPTGEAFDNFGNALAVGDFNDDGIDDLAIGTAGEDDTFANSGAVTVILGRHLQPLVGSTVRRLFPRGSPGTPSYDPAGMIPDYQQGTPFWGFSLASGDFDGNGFDDLAIGAPARNASASQPDTGAVAVIYGQLFADGFESGNAGEWSQVMP